LSSTVRNKQTRKEEEEDLQGQLFHADTNNAPHDGSHAERWDVKTGWYLDTDSEHGDDNLKDESQRQQPEGAIHSRSRQSTFSSERTGTDCSGEISVIITERNDSNGFIRKQRSTNK